MLRPIFYHQSGVVRCVAVCTWTLRNIRYIVADSVGVSLYVILTYYSEYYMYVVFATVLYLRLVYLTYTQLCNVPCIRTW